MSVIIRETLEVPRIPPALRFCLNRLRRRPCLASLPVFGRCAESASIGGEQTTPKRGESKKSRRWHSRALSSYVLKRDAVEWQRMFGVTVRVFEWTGPRDCRTKAQFSILYPAYRLCVSRRSWLRAPAAAATAVSFSSPPSTVPIPPLRPSVSPSIHPPSYAGFFFLLPTLVAFTGFVSPPLPTAALETLLPPFQAGIFGGSFVLGFSQKFCPLYVCLLRSLKFQQNVVPF